MCPRLQVEDPLPESPYTKDIPGGRQIAWGMALNKLKVLGMTEFKRVRSGCATATAAQREAAITPPPPAPPRVAGAVV